MKLIKKAVLLLSFIIIINSFSYSEVVKIARVEGNIEQTVASKILEEVYKRANIPVEFVDLPGQRALELSSTGLIDGETIRIFELDTMYPTLVRVPTPYYYPETVVFTKKQDFEVSGWESIINYKIGIVRGMKYYEIQLKDAKNVEKVNDVEKLMQMLDLERIDVVVETDINGLYQASLIGFDDIKILEEPLFILPLYHYLHESKKDLIPKIDEVIKDMRDSGELIKIKEATIKSEMERARANSEK